MLSFYVCKKRRQELVVREFCQHRRQLGGGAELTCRAALPPSLPSRLACGFASCLGRSGASPAYVQGDGPKLQGSGWNPPRGPLVRSPSTFIIYRFPSTYLHPVRLQALSTPRAPASPRAPNPSHAPLRHRAPAGPGGRRARPGRHPSGPQGEPARTHRLAPPRAFPGSAPCRGPVSEAVGSAATRRGHRARRHRRRASAARTFAVPGSHGLCPLHPPARPARFQHLLC